jgi:hypothetical protein
VAGTQTEVEAASVSGAITVRGGERIRAEGTNASVTLIGVSGVVDAQTVNGRLDVSGGVFQEAHLETVNGALRFEGDLRSGSTLDVETVQRHGRAAAARERRLRSRPGPTRSDFRCGSAPRTSGAAQRGGDGRHKHKNDDDDEEGALHDGRGSAGERHDIERRVIRASRRRG